MHSLGVAHARHGIGQVDAQHLLEQVAHQPFHQLLDLRLIEERSLDVELGEFRLPVRAQIFVPKTAHDLIVALEARNHQQLLVNLRRLRQREKFSRMGAAGHQVIARALRRRLGEHRRLDVDEARVIEIVPHRARDPMPQQQSLAHFFAPQIDIAKAQPHLFADMLVELKRQGLRTVQNLEFLAQHLDLAGLQVGIRGAGRPRPDHPGNLQHELIAHAFRHREHGGLVRIEYDLQQPLPVAQIDENDAAMVPAAMGPARDGDRLAGQGLVDLAAIMSAHKRVNFGWRKRAMLRLGRCAGKPKAPPRVRSTARALAASHLLKPPEPPA